MMKSTKITRLVSLVLLGFFVLYGIFAIPFAFFLLALSAGLIVYGTSESVEMAALTVLLGGALIVLISQYKKGPAVAAEGFADTAVDISKRVRSLTPTVSGTFSGKGVEGFEDISTTAATEKEAPPLPPPGSVDSKPAPASAPAEPPGLFKLGVLPEETKGGFHIDQGTTVMNALNALNPDQVKRMSDDTQKLIDTQKSLMSMLGTMKPMLTDGKQLMETFQQMFGPGGAAPAPEKPKA